MFAKSLKAQNYETRFGLKGGVNLTFFTVDQQNLGLYSQTETGFYGGAFIEFPIDEPEALYSSVGDFNFLNVPIYAKYQIANKLHLLAGPSVNYFFDFFTSKVKIGADISSSYRITNALDVHLKYALGLTELAPNGLFWA